MLAIVTSVETFQSKSGDKFVKLSGLKRDGGTFECVVNQVKYDAMKASPAIPSIEELQEATSNLPVSRLEFDNRGFLDSVNPVDGD